MARCTPFTVTFSADPEQLFEKAINKAQQTGARVRGNAQDGEVQFKVPMFGAIRVHYRISGQSITFTCKDRPMLLSCALLEQTVRDEISSADKKLCNNF